MIFCSKILFLGYLIITNIYLSSCLTLSCLCGTHNSLQSATFVMKIETGCQYCQFFFFENSTFLTECRIILGKSVNCNRNVYRNIIIWSSLILCRGWLHTLITKNYILWLRVETPFGKTNVLQPATTKMKHKSVHVCLREKPWVINDTSHLVRTSYHIQFCFIHCFLFQ